jgi:hypothetical protein
MKTVISAILGSLVVVGIAQAQTTTILDTTLNVPTFLQDSMSFNVSGPSTLFIEGATVSNSVVQGAGILELNGAIVDTFALTNGSVNTPVFNQLTLSAPGTYNFLYDFANSNSTVGNTVTVEATVTPISSVSAPEIEPASTLSALSLLVGGILVVRGRRKEPMPA